MTSADQPAFPVVPHSSIHIGLTKREYFAAMMLQALLTKAGTPNLAISSEACMYADELLRQLETTKS